MGSSIFSDSWHRVYELVPKLRNHTKIYRHHYRGELWYVLQDKLSGKSHRFSPSAHYIIGLMDGQRTVQKIWDLATESLGDDAPTQDDLIQLLSQLHGADALQSNLAPDTTELLERHQKIRRQDLMQRFMNPLALKFPLLDPEKFLNKALPYVRPLCGPFAMLVWGVVVFVGLVQAALHWSDLTQNMSDRVLATQSLIVLTLLFPLIKAFHEMGHAIATKIWGGEVHEMGVMMLVLMPVPYVDASAASAFRDRRKRVVVGAGGMMVELFFAAIALFVWLSVEEGLIHVIAYNTMLIAGVSTILFNANPLLRFDGYYILADLIEMPNLGARSNKYLGYLCKRYLFAVKDAEHDPTTPSERAWFLFYSIGSFIYRMFIAFFIVMFVAGKFFFVGVLLAMWSIIMMIIVPAFKTLSKLFTDPGIRRKQTRALTVTAGSISFILLVILLLPMPSWTRAEGVVWVPGEALIRAGADCYVDKVYFEPGVLVAKGDPLLQCHNAELKTRVAVLKARMEEIEAMHTAEVVNDRVRAKIASKERENIKVELQQAEREASKLVIYAKSSGILIIPGAQDLKGRYVRKGELLGYTLNKELVTARVVVAQQDIDLVRHNTKNVELRLSGNVSKVVQTKVISYTPSATDELPSLALTVEGGGIIAINPAETERMKAFQKYFIVDLDLPAEAKTSYLGSRIYVKFGHGFSPLGVQWYRSIRQLLLTQLNV